MQAGTGSWQLPDEVWARMEPLIPPRKSKEGDRVPLICGAAPKGFFYVLRTGIQWQAVPRERCGPPSTVYYYFRRWVEEGGSGSSGRKRSGCTTISRGWNGPGRALTER